MDTLYSSTLVFYSILAELMMESKESTKKMGGELSNTMRGIASRFKEQIGDSSPCHSDMLLEGRRNTRSKSNHQHCNVKEMSSGIRNEGDILTCLHWIWSEESIQISNAKLQILSAKATSISAHF